MKKIKRRAKRSYFGYIFTVISILVVFLLIPQILFVKSAKLMKNTQTVKENVPPSSDFYIAKNYLDLLVFFPGFSDKSKEIINDVTIFYLGKYTNEVTIKKDSILSVLLFKIRLERDSIFNNSDILEQKTITKYYDSLENQFSDKTWIEAFENKNEFCEKWSLFFEKSEIDTLYYSNICK